MVELWLFCTNFYLHIGPGKIFINFPFILTDPGKILYISNALNIFLARYLHSQRVQKTYIYDPLCQKH